MADRSILFGDKILLYMSCDLGGGVMKQLQLFPIICREVQRMLNGYVQTPQIQSGIDDYIVPPGLGDNVGLSGALVIAKRELQSLCK